MLTVDCVALGLRLNEFRNSFALPADVKWPNIESKGLASATATDDDSCSYGSWISFTEHVGMERD